MTLKTKPSTQSVEDFIEAISNETKRNDCRTLISLMKEITGEPPVLWGPSMVGFGQYHYVYDTGTEGDWFITGFSPRKNNLSIYLMDGCSAHQERLDKLGKYKNSISCLYVNKLSDVDIKVLREIIEISVAHTRQKYS